MSEIYRKWGRVVRWEHGHLLVIEESGEAVESDDSFVARPTGERAPMANGLEERVGSVMAAARAIERLGAIERLIVSEGIAEHEFGGVRWSETTRRVHFSLARGSMRLLIDRAGFDLAPLERLADALGRAGTEREAPRRLRLAQNVAAAILPSLIAASVPGLELWQSAGGVDGKGNAILERRVETPPWPNWYRPSYRVRPVRTPLNVRAAQTETPVDRSLPEAVALMAPVEEHRARVLIEEGDAVYPAVVRIERISAVGPAGEWFPYAAGTYGAEIML
jgi:hypothetical protein